MELTNKVKLVNLSCPSCGGKLVAEENTKKLVCQSCNNLVMPVAESSSTSNNIQSQMSIKIDGINNPSSGIAFVEQFFQNFEWESFQIDTTLYSIASIDRLVENLKTTSADNPQTWLIQFESLATPVQKKIEGLSQIEQQIEALYLPNLVNDAFSKFDNMQSVVRLLKQNKDRIIKVLNQSIELCKRYGLDLKNLTILEKRSLLIDESISELKLYDYLEDMPLIESKKGKIDKQIAKRLQAVDINADKTYEDGVKHYKQGDYNKALELLLIVKEYKNSYQIIQKIQRDYQFDSYLEISDKPYIYTQPAVLATNTQLPFQAKNLYQVKDQLGKQPAVVKNIRQRLNTYGNKFFFIDSKNEICVYDQNKIRKLGKFTGVLSNFQSYLDTSGTQERFLVSKDFGETLNKARVDSSLNPNLFYLAALNYQKETFNITLKNISDLVGIYDEKIVYYAFPQEANSDKYLFEKNLFVYDIKTQKTTTIGDSKDSFQEFYNEFAVVLRKNGGKSNFDLIIVSLIDQSEIMIEKNVFDYFKVINNRFYYNVGSKENHSLISNGLERASRVQVLRYMKEVLFTQDHHLYILQGNLYRSGLIRFDTSTGKSQLVIDDLDEIYGFKYGYIFYKDSEGSLCRVRMDGANRQILSEDAGDIITIKNNFIYYSILENEKNNQDSQSTPTNPSSGLLKLYNERFNQARTLISKISNSINKATGVSSSLNIFSRQVRSLYRMNADGHAKQKLAYDIVSAKEHSEDAIDFIVKVPNEKIEKKLMRLNTETLNETFVSYLGVEKGNNKSKSLAILLGFLVGWLGIHNFYIGYGYRGIAQLVVTLFGFIFASPIFILMSLMSAWIEIGQIKKGNPNSTPAGIEIE